MTYIIIIIFIITIIIIIIIWNIFFAVTLWLYLCAFVSVS
jgi:hypothetical protein